MPNETLIYFGDTGRVPYGGRSRDTIIRYARQDVAFLRTFDLKAVVVACGTVSATALPQLQAEQDIPVFGVVEPTARQAAEETRNQKIGLIATRATIRTGAYERGHRPAGPCGGGVPSGLSAVCAPGGKRSDPARAMWSSRQWRRSIWRR